MRVLLAATLAALLSVASTCAFAAAQDCQPQAIRDLERRAPRGYAVYLAMRDKTQFLVFLTCRDVQLGLSTAVHESVHILTEDRDAYPLIAGGFLPRQHGVSQFCPPREIAGKFKADSYVQTYLRRGAASSADDLIYLLDELNAHSHDLATASQLIGLKQRDEQVDHRAGLAALMAFFLAYVEVARERKASTWEGLRRPESKQLLANDRLPAHWWLRRRDIPATPVRPAQRVALTPLFGRPPIGASACVGLATAASPMGAVTNTLRAHWRARTRAAQTG
jgi:hypothetical protein